MLVVLSGLPGVGKTSDCPRARPGDRCRLPANRLDRAGPEERGLPGGRGGVQRRLRRSPRTTCDSAVPSFADCVNPWPLTRSEWRSVADRARVRALDVEIVCSDAVEHRRRVESRRADIPGHQLPTWSQVVERDYRAWTGDRLVVDTGQLNVEQSVRTILSALKES